MDHGRPGGRHGRCAGLVAPPRDDARLDGGVGGGEGKPDVITPSKNEPMSAWLLSPPVPSTIAPSCFIGA